MEIELGSQKPYNSLKSSRYLESHENNIPQPLLFSHETSSRHCRGHLHQGTRKALVEEVLREMYLSCTHKWNYETSRKNENRSSARCNRDQSVALVRTVGWWARVDAADHLNEWKTRLKEDKSYDSSA